MSLASFYKTLGVPQSANLADIKRAYRALAFKYHPDYNTNEGASKQFMQIQNAYTVLEAYYKTGYRPKNHSEQVADDFRTQTSQKKQHTARSKRRNRPSPHDFKRAQEQRKKEKEAKDRKLYQDVYDKYCNSWRIVYGATIATFCAILAVVVLVDFSLDTEAEKTYAVHGDFFNDDTGGFISIDGAEYRVQAEIYFSVMNRKPLIVHRTPIFHDVQCISSAIPGFTNHAYPLSMVTYGPITAFLLLLPGMGFLYKRPDFNFTFFFIHFTMYAAPAIVFYFFLSGGRLLAVLGF